MPRTCWCGVNGGRRSVREQSDTEPAPGGRCEVRPRPLRTSKEAHAAAASREQGKEQKVVSAEIQQRAREGRSCRAFQVVSKAHLTVGGMGAAGGSEQRAGGQMSVSIRSPWLLW